MEIHALKKRGWKVADIARHVGHDPKTVRAYLDGERIPGKRRSAKPDRFDLVPTKASFRQVSLPKYRRAVDKKGQSPSRITGFVFAAALATRMGTRTARHAGGL